MTKSELTALGLDAETIKAVQRLNGQDMQRVAAKLQNPGKDNIRAAITAMIQVIRQMENLKAILTQVNYLYYAENRHTERAAADAANTDDGKADQNETPDSASSVDENMGGCQA